ncbi:MAG: glycosyltransferase family 4 protein [Candidatus Paceibacterota bacterium]|jgi:glycosyltransferase involved in cell wall biosynthesis
MKICVYIPTGSFFVGGGETVPLTQARYLQKIGHEVKVVVTKVEKESEYFQNYKKQYPGIAFDYLDSPIPDIENRTLDHKLCHVLYFELSRKFAYYCLSNSFDVVITHYSVAAIGIPSSIPQILYLHGTPGQYEPVNEAACQSADKLVAVSQSVSDGWKAMFQIDKDISVIRNGIDENDFHPALGILKEIDILYIGRLIEIKGVQHLIEAIRILRDRMNRTDIKVAIYGNGPFKDQLVNQVNQSGLQSLINFGGYVETPKLPLLYNRTKLAVFPSYAKEGVLTTMLEAAASGCCIITSNCCGMAEFIIDNTNGLLFTPQDPANLAEKINTALADNDLRSRLEKQARISILEAWTWDHAIAKLDKIILELKK